MYVENKFMKKFRNFSVYSYFFPDQLLLLGSSCPPPDPRDAGGGAIGQNLANSWRILTEWVADSAGGRGGSAG